MINFHFPKNLIVFAIGFFILSLTACQTEKSPEETSLAFWAAFAKNDIESAKKYCTVTSQGLLSKSPVREKLNQAHFGFGRIVIDAEQATVETLVTWPTNARSSFTTYLIKEDNHWRVDFLHSSSAHSINNIFGGVLKSLNTLGETFSRQIEKQLPLIEKEMESLGNELKQEIDEFGEELEKSFPETQTDPYKDSI